MILVSFQWTMTLRFFQRKTTLKDFSAADPRWPGVTPALQGPSPPEACSCPRQTPGLGLFQEPCSSLDRIREEPEGRNWTQAF